MQTLQIDAQKAKKLFPEASIEFKAILTDTFGEKFFIQKITDRVKTFEDACEVLDVAPEHVLNLVDTVDEQAYKKLKTIIRALNEGWVPDWNNSSQYKWYPYFKFTAGFGFSYTDCDGWDSRTAVGSRLCFKSEELAQYAGTQFQSLYNDFLTI